MDDIRKNSEGYSDPTAYAGLRAVLQREQEETKQLNTLIYILKYIINLSDYELLGRIELKHKKSGKVYR